MSDCQHEWYFDECIHCGMRRLPLRGKRPVVHPIVTKDDAVDPLAAMTAERDAWAAESADNLRKLVEATARIDAMRDDIITLGAQVNSLMRERDEARGKALKMEEWSVEAELENVRLRRERDAALAQVPRVVIHHLRTILDEAEHHTPGSVAQNIIIYAANKALDALTPADATAAIDRIKRQARAEGMRKAATICNRSYGDGLGAAHKAILAAAEQEERNDE